MSRKLSKDFTQGNIPKQLLHFMVPFMLSNAMQVLYSAIDMMIVGNYVGTAGLSAVSQSSLIINFAVMVCFGVSNAGQVLVSQALGSDKRDRLNSIIGTLFSMLIILSLVFTFVFICFHKQILTLIRVPKESFADAGTYLIICSVGLVFTAGYNMISAVLRGMGDSKRPMLFILIATVINLVLDIIFTGFWGWGVAGAAWATIIGQAAAFLFACFYLYRSKEAFGFDFKPKSFKINKNYAGMIVAQGTPMAIQSACINISMLYVTSSINSVGVVASATFGAGTRIDDIINKISQGIQFATMPMVSQNIGAGKQERAKHVVYWAWVYSIGLTAVFMILYLFFGKFMFGLFSDDIQVLDMSGTFISAILWMFPAFSVMRGSGAFISGIGHAKLCMVLAMMDGIVLRVGLSWFFGSLLGWGFYGYVLGYALAPYGYAVPSMIYFLSGVWKKRRALAEDL